MFKIKIWSLSFSVSILTFIVHNEFYLQTPSVKFMYCLTANSAAIYTLQIFILQAKQH